MNYFWRQTRRKFLRTTGMALGSLSILSKSLQASGERKRDESASLTDANVWLGSWPFRRLAQQQVSTFAATLRRNGVTRAWAGNFDVLAGSESQSNKDLVKACRRERSGLFVPFGTVNLRSSGWREELRRCHEDHRMPGLRLVPNYHGYELDEPEFAELLALANARRLILQVVCEIEDERVQARPARPPLDAKSLPGLLKAANSPRLMMLNWFRAVKPELLKELARAGVVFDISMVEGVGGIASLFERVPPQQIVLGSNAPFFYFQSALLKLRESALTHEQIEQIGYRTARALGEA